MLNEISNCVHALSSLGKVEALLVCYWVSALLIKFWRSGRLNAFCQWKILRLVVHRPAIYPYPECERGDLLCGPDWVDQPASVDGNQEEKVLDWAFNFLDTCDRACRPYTRRVEGVLEQSHMFIY